MSYGAKRMLRPTEEDRDEYFRDVILLLQGQGDNNGNNVAVDDVSSQNRTVTNSGTALKSAFNPYTRPDGYWAVQFTASNSDYLQLINDTDYTLPGDYTIEFWVKAPSQSDKGILGGRNGVNRGLHITTGGYSGTTVGALRWVSNAGSLVSTTVICDMQWHHCAIVRSSNTVKIYVDGVNEGSLTDGNGYNTSSGQMELGKLDLAANHFEGLIADFRWVKGTAVYTSNFTPPTKPLTAISGTACLVASCNRHRDRSGNDKDITVTNWPACVAESPYAVPLGYGRDVSSFRVHDQQALTASSQITVGTDDFCLEWWVYPSGSSDDSMFESRDANLNATGCTVTILTNDNIRMFTSGVLINGPNLRKMNNQWNHVALTRDSGTCTLYWNGVSLGTTTSFTNWSDSKFRWGDSDLYGSFDGYLCDLRFVTNDPVYTANFTPPTEPLDEITGTQILLRGSDINLWDSAANACLVPLNDAVSSTTQSKWGGSSLHFDGTGDQIFTKSQGNLALKDGDFTIESWVYFDVVYSAGTRGQGVFQYEDDDTLNSFGWPFMAADGNGRWQMGYGTGNVSHASEGPSEDTWYHMALVRYNGTIKLYIDGVEKLSQSDSTDYTRTRLVVGAYASNADRLNGYIDDFRITKGVARYTAGFTPPAKRFPTF